MKMKSKRRWLASIMAFVMLTSALPVTAFAEGHTHTEECYAKEGDLLCTISESEGHNHTSDCVCPGGEYICGLEETEGHTHNESCYDYIDDEESDEEEATPSNAVQKELVCGLEEQEGHTHTSDCVCPGGENICGLEETEGHTHGEDCYAKGGELICNLNGLDEAAELNQEIVPDASGTAWKYSQYYVEYSGLSASTKNRYQLDIKGNGISTTQGVKYQFQFHNSEDYQAGEVKIYLPYSLYQDRYDKDVLPSQIGVPEAPDESSVSDFNYSVETLDGETLLCFTNCKDLHSGSDNVVQIMYALNDMDTIDGTSWEITPKIYVLGNEAEEDKLGTTLKGSMDTEAHLTMTEKAAYTGSKDYLPQLYTPKQVEAWTGKSDLTEEDFKENCYLLWRTVIQTSASQPWSLEIKDQPSHNGTVIGQFISKKDSVEDRTGCLYYSDSDTLNVPEQRLYGDKYYIYTVTAYPRKSMPEDNLVENDITVTLTGADDRKTETKKSSAQWIWQEYKRKDLVGRNYIYKTYNINLEHQPIGQYTENGWLDVYREAAAQGSDLALPGPWYVGFVSEWYDKVYDDPGYSYSYALIDDLQFACTNEDQYQKMSYEDYYYQDIKFYCTEKSIDGEDIYENKYVIREDGEPFAVYVMTAASPDEWQKVADVPFADISSYEIPQQYYDEGIYEIKAEHSSNAGASRVSFSAKTVLRADSPLLTSYINNPDISKVQILNLAGGVNMAEDGSYYTDDGAPYGQWPETTNVDLDAYELENYGCKRIRDFDFITLNGLTETGNAGKTVKLQNDATNGRVGMTYTLSGWDGYNIYDTDAVSILKAAGVTPGRDRNEVTMYDLLPLGITFDASVPVKAGSITSQQYADISGSWDSSDVSVSYTVTDNYRGSGRQMIKFTISYTGSDNTVCDRKNGDYAYKWFSGYGIEFGAYYLWKDYDLANAGVNVMAYATPTRIKGNGYKDDGTGVPISVGTDSDGRSYFYDPEDDGVSDEPYILYAQAATNSDFALASKANIRKTVKADADIFSAPGSSASVSLGKTYTYQIQVTNSSEKTHDLIIYDHLENAAKDRVNEEMGFDDNYWQGTFESVNLSAAKAMGIAPVVYYSANREQEMSLEVAGWVRSDEWTQALSEVHSIAFDLSHKTNGEEFVLEPMNSVYVSIKMRAPEEMKLPAVYAYNNPAFYCYYTMSDTGTESDPELVIGNSVKVKLHDSTTLAVEKTVADGIGAPADTSFAFQVKIDGAAWAEKEYTLSENGKSDGQLHATDKNGVLYLKAGQRAVFEDVPAGSDYSVTEQAGNNWRADQGAERTGTLQEGEEAVVSYANHYQSLLYVEKRLKYAQDYTPNADAFTFRLTLDGKSAANVEYALVDREASYKQDPAVIEDGLKTDADGCFTLTASQRAMFRVDAGTNYTLTEISVNPDYSCEEAIAAGTVKGDAELAYITNNYKYKDLYIVKKMVAADGVETPADYNYSFVLTLNGAAAANQPYELYQQIKNEETGAVSYEKTADMRTDADGRFTLTPSQYARVTHLTAGAAYTVTEDTGNMPEHVKPYSEASVSGTLPQYAPSKTATIENQYQLQALEVSKTVLAAEDVSSREFTFTIKINGQPYAERQFSRVSADGTKTEAQTEAGGTFTLKDGEKALFTSLKVGDTYEVTEAPDANYVQVLPADNAAAAGTITDDLSAAKAEFQNAAPGSTLWVTKSVQSKIDGLAESLVNKEEYKYCVEVNGQPYAGKAYTLVSEGGTASQRNTDKDGCFTMYASQRALFSDLNIGDSYTVYELAKYPKWDNGSNGWHDGSSIYWRQIIPENGGDASGKINASPQTAAFTNEITRANQLSIAKYINGKYPSNVGYDGTAVFKLKLTLRDNDGRLYVGPDTLLGCNKNDFKIDEDGIITITASYMYELSYIYLYIPFGYDFKLEEVGGEPEEVFGRLSAVTIGDESRDGYHPDIDEDGFVKTDKTYVQNMGTLYYDIEFFNTNATEKFKVYKQAEGGRADQTFTFTLYKSDVLNYDRGDTREGEAEPSYKFVIMPDEPYDVYDTASGELLAQRSTNANGQFTIQGGQYAEFTGYRYSKDSDTSDGFWLNNPDANDTIYKVVETPYADYVPQVTTIHSTTKRISGYWGDDGKWVAPKYDTTVTTTTAQANGGSMMAGDRMTFTNTYGNSSSLVVSKTVTTREGVTAPEGDEFTFQLTVDGRPYSNQSYTRFNSDGEKIVNTQNEQDADGNEYDIEHPWTTDAYGRFTLKADEHAVFDWVGEGKSYTVTEESKNGYTQVTPAAGTGISDIITASGAKAEFVNLYNRNPKTEGAALTVQKLLALPYGLKTMPEEDFTFRVMIDGAAYAQKSYTVYTTDGKLAAKDQMTDENGELTLKGDQYAVFSSVPVDVDYEITEQLASGSAYTALGNTKQTGVTEQDGTAVTFTNVFGNLLVSKQVENVTAQTAPAEDTFSFIITLDDKAGANLPYWILNADMEKIGEASTASDGSFSLHADESALFYGLTLGDSYKVKERGKTYYTQTVPVGQDGYSGDIGSTASKLLFINEYSKLAALEISKQTVNKEGESISSDEPFTFRVTIGGKAYADKSYVIYGADGYKKAGIYTSSDDGCITLYSGERAVMTGVLPGAKYQVEEVNIPDGYTPDQKTFTGTVAQTGTSADFVNVREDKTPEAETGNLTVSKVVAGNAGDTNKAFTFTVTLSDSTISGSYGDMTFANGTASFTLKHKEQKTATGLPAGISYDVTEKEANKNGYTTVSTGASGTIEKDKTAAAAFTNTRNNGGDDVGNLIVSKLVAGNAGDTSKAFSFTVKLSDSTINGNYGDMIFANGTASFTLKHKEQKTATELPAGISYEITETEANQDGYTTTVTGASGSIVKDQTAAAAFTNTKNSEGDDSYDDVGNLIVSKIVSGNAGDTNKAFSFTVKLGNSTISGNYGDMTFANGTATFTLKHSEKKMATGLPAGISYEVTESEANQNGYTTTATGANGSIVKNQTVTVAFTNTKRSSGGGSHGGGGSDGYGYGNLTVSKTVSGTAGDITKAFTFTIKLDHSISGKYGDMTFDKGIATIKLKHGESSTAKGLPSEIHYSVMESDNEGYMVSAVGDSGIIGEGKTVVAAFTNNKDTTPNNPNVPNNPDTPNAPNNPDAPTTPDKPTVPKDPTPQTGDESNVNFWLSLMIISFAAFTGVCIYGRKRRDTGHHVQK